MFLCGDYEFLCRMFGLSGASGAYSESIQFRNQCAEITVYVLFLLGRHCCLWCLITQEQLKLPPSTRGSVTARTTKSICEDHEKYVKAGANPKMAKHHNNCISKPFFSLPCLCHRCVHDNITSYTLHIPYVNIRCAPQDYTSHWASSYDYLCFWKTPVIILISQQSLQVLQVDGALNATQLLFVSREVYGTKSTRSTTNLPYSSRVQPTQWL